MAPVNPMIEARFSTCLVRNLRQSREMAVGQRFRLSSTVAGLHSLSTSCGVDVGWHERRRMM